MPSRTDPTERTGAVDLVLRVLAPLPGHALRRFATSCSGSFAVVDALQDTFPGRFTTVSPAAVELHATMSLFHDQAIHVHLAPDADGERQFGYIRVSQMA